MSDPVTICNQSLIKVGANPVVSLDAEQENVTAEVEACNIVYGPAKRLVLRSYDWNCANWTERLALLSEPPVDPRWKYAFSWPEDCIRILEIIEVGSPDQRGSGEPVPFESARKMIFSNCEHIAARYVSDVPEPFLDDHVEMVIVAQVALDLSYALTSSNTREGNLDALLEKKMNEARTTDAQERTHKKFRIDTLDRARG